MSAAPTLSADRLLVKQCVAGENAAWHHLDGEFHECLLRQAVALMHGGTVDGNTPEDVVQDVLSSLCEHECRCLDVFDPERVPLAVYLAGLVKYRVLTLCRRGRWRKAHQLPLDDCDPPDLAAGGGLLEAELREFTESLPPGDQRCFREDFLGDPQPAETPPAEPAAARQRRHSVQERARDYFDGR